VHFHLRDVLGLLAVASCFGAWYAAERQEFSREQSLLRAGPKRTYGLDAPKSDWGIGVRSTRAGGFTWLRRLCGDKWFAFLDRPIYVHAATSALPTAAQLTEVQILELDGDVTSDDLAVLERFPRLQVVEFGFADVVDDRQQVSKTVELPRLPSLLGLNLEASFERRGVIRGLKELKSLEVLNLDRCELDEEALRDLGSLTKLRELSLAQSRMPNDSCRYFGNLNRLQRLVVTYTELDDESLGAISRLGDLRNLVLCGNTIPKGALRHLATLERLEVLNLASSTVTFNDISELQPLHHLQVLDLRHVPISDEQRNMLREWLPKCDIRE
jgi:hypothetical protein